MSRGPHYKLQLQGVSMICRQSIHLQANSEHEVGILSDWC